MMKQSRHSRRVGICDRAAAEDRHRDEHHEPGDGEPRRGHDERRDRLDRDPDPEVRRPPDDVQDQDRGPDEHGRGRPTRLAASAPGRALA